MDTSNFDADIQRFETELETLRQEMDEVRDRFFVATEPFASDWISTKVEQEVKKNSDLTLQKGREGIGKLKSELNDLVARVPELVAKHVGRDENWAHRSGDQPYDLSGNYYVFEGRLP